jgi:hypothetical protein
VHTPDEGPGRAVIGAMNAVFVDGPRARLQRSLVGPDDFEVDLVANSRESSPAKATAQIHLDRSIDEARFGLAERGVP